jgi:hypothetical protein
MSNFPEIEYKPFRPDGESLAVEPEATPLDFLSAVYRDQRQPMQRRMRAAEICCAIRASDLQGDGGCAC